MRRIIPVIIFTAVLVGFTAPAEARRDRHRDNWSVNLGWNSWNDTGFVNIHYNNWGHRPVYFHPAPVVHHTTVWHQPVYRPPVVWTHPPVWHAPVYRPPVSCAPVRPAPVFHHHTSWHSSSWHGW